MKCPCPLHCRYCGRKRSRDPVGHYCKTPNCQWQHGYSTCPVSKKQMTESERVQQLKAILKTGPMATPQIKMKTQDCEGSHWGLSTVIRTLKAGPFEMVKTVPASKPGFFRIGLKTMWRLKRANATT